MKRKTSHDDGSETSPKKRKPTDEKEEGKPTKQASVEGKKKMKKIKKQLPRLPVRKSERTRHSVGLSMETVEDDLSDTEVDVQVSSVYCLHPIRPLGMDQ